MVEVSLAILVVGVGFLAIFSLFPASLRSSESDTEDTRRGMFMDTVLAGLRANAAAIKDRNTWDDPAQFQAAMKKGSLSWLTFAVATNSGAQKIGFPNSASTLDEDQIRYRLYLSDGQTNGVGYTNVVYNMVLEVANGADGPFSDVPAAYTEFVYTGD